jgi:hypothetical protein
MISTWTVRQFASALSGKVRSRAAAAESARRPNGTCQCLADRSLGVVTLDKVLARAAESLGLRTELPA